MEDMLVEFTMGVDIYLQNLRDVNKSDAKMRMVSGDESLVMYVGFEYHVQGTFFLKFGPVVLTFAPLV